MITTYKPTLQDLWFRQQFMADKATMSYNAAWGGTIPFPENTWKEWYDRWLIHHENKDVTTYAYDMENFRVEADVVPGTVFYSWVFGFGGKVVINGPAEVKEQYKEMVLQAAERV